MKVVKINMNGCSVIEGVKTPNKIVFWVAKSISIGDVKTPS